nr:hypothetical protein [Tanacetum cinerariifolium]
EGDEYTREVIRMEYDWKPPHCVECKCFGNDPNSCHKRVVIPKAMPKAPTTSSAVDNENRFVVVTIRKKKKKTGPTRELSGLDKNQSVSNAVNAEGNDIGEKDGTTVVNENVMSQPQESLWKKFFFGKGDIP